MDIDGVAKEARGGHPELERNRPITGRYGAAVKNAPTITLYYGAGVPHRFVAGIGIVSNAREGILHPTKTESKRLEGTRETDGTVLNGLRQAFGDNSQPENILQNVKYAITAQCYATFIDSSNNTSEEITTTVGNGGVGDRGEFFISG